MSHVFISYAREDSLKAIQLSEDLKNFGIKVWLDQDDILGGDEWELALRHAIRDSSHFIALISKSSASKRGYVQKEIREAVGVLEQLPERSRFIIPVRLDETQLPHSALERLQWIDLFPDYNYHRGLIRILRTLKPEAAKSLEKQVVQETQKKLRAEVVRSIDDYSITAVGQTLVLKKLSPRVQKEFLARMALLSQESAVHFEMVSNLYSETRLPSKAFKAIVEAVLSAEPDVVSLETAIRGTCQRWVLQGSSIGARKARIYGTVIASDRFADLLVKSLCFVSTSEAQRFVASNIVGQREVPEDVHHLPLGRYMIWATYNLDDGSPFGANESTDVILCSLGRPNLEGGESLLVFEYTLPEDIEPRFPTFCDAYASSLWDRLFRVAPPGASSGWSMPLHNCPIQRGRPELVHLPVTLGNVTSARIV